MMGFPACTQPPEGCLASLPARTEMSAASAGKVGLLFASRTSPSDTPNSTKCAKQKLTNCNADQKCELQKYQ
eukprot:4125732-Amphidinium_carterae.1